jgi:hypothetical protein
MFDSAIFDSVVFDTGDDAAAVATTPAARGSAGWLSGRYAPGDRRRTKDDIRRDRERFGVLTPAAAEVIAEVAVRQVERGETDAQKRFEELHRELELRRIEWDARYLEALAAMREHYIEAARVAQDEEALVLLIALAV